MTYTLLKILVKLGIIPKLVKATVVAVIIKNNKILLEKRSAFIEKNKWCLPGGHIDFGETAEQAIRREVKEELGLTIKNLKFMGYFDEIMPEIRNHSLVLVYTTGATRNLKLQKEEVSEVGWFTKEEISKLNMAFRHAELIKKFWKK